MLELKDLNHLPEVEPLIAELAADAPGLIIVAGLDARAASAPGTRAPVPPSGRAAIFRILVRRMLGSRPMSHAIVVAEADTLRLPRQFRHRVSLSLVEPHQSYARAIEVAARRRPDLVVVDRLTAETAPAALEAAERGLHVLAQIDTVFRGAGVARHLLDLGVSRTQLALLTWVVAVHRVPTLCPQCKRPTPPAAAALDGLVRRYPGFDSMLGLTAGAALDELDWHAAAGCEQCQSSGRQGEITAFDLFRADPQSPDILQQPSRLPLEAYMLRLAARGDVPLADVLDLDGDQLRRTFQLLVASDSTLHKATADLERKITELEVANQVLQQRTEALISLQGVGHALTTSTGLDDLAARLCRHASDLCGADRAILYFLRPDGETAEILAAIGWDPVPIRQPLDAAPLLAEIGPGPVPAHQYPPGVPRRATDATLTAMRTGLRVPLMAQGRPVGVMIVHTGRKSYFGPGETALLQMFADQAALAIQRTWLIESLQDKIVQLEAAQVELVKKERMERELELARQVQQSVLPHIFPLVPGYRFAARSQPARQVGGDFYDVILLDAERVGVVVGDVSDKGLPAALYMALARSLLLAESRRATSPRDVLASVHRLLLELGQPHMFVTIFYGVLDGTTGLLTYCRAGHDRPLLVRHGQVQYLGGEGMLLGFPEVDDVHLSEEEMEMLPGDRLVLYTDGLTDARSPEGRTFGLERLSSLIQPCCELPADELCSTILAELAAYQGSAEQYDDVTLLVVDVE